jgi:hypothetical protein
MHVDDIRCCLLQHALQRAKAKGIPHSAHGTLHRAVEFLLKYFIAVPAKLYHRMAVVLKKSSLGAIGAILPARCRRSVKIVNEKNFHNKNIRMSLVRWFTVHKPFFCIQSDTHEFIFFQIHPAENGAGVA